jgi:hypothetical protein
MAELPPGVTMEKLMKCYERAVKHNEKEKKRYREIVSTEEGRAKILGHAKVSYERNREKILAERKRYYEENRDVLLARAKVYQQRKKAEAAAAAAVAAAETSPAGGE